MTSCIHKTQKWTIPIRHIKDHNSGKNQPTVRWIHIGMSYCSFHVDILKIHHFVCVFLNVQPNHSVLQGCDFWQCGQKKLCMPTFCILLNTCFLEMWLVKEENLLKVLFHIAHAILKFGSPLWIKDTLYMLDVRIDTVKIFTTNSTYHCEMHFGTTVAYRRVNLRCSTFASEVLHAVKIVVCFSPKETMMKHKAHQ